MIASFSPKSLDDSWTYNLASDGKFSTNLIRSKLDLYSSCSLCPKVYWLKMVPIKVTCFIWRCSIGRIPSEIALKSGGVLIKSNVCGYCNVTIEDLDHILVVCQAASITRKWILQCCAINDRHFAQTGEFLDFAST